MTNIPIRILRDGKWQPVDIDEMTDQELMEVASSWTVTQAGSFAITLAKWIRDNVKPPEEQK